MVNTKFRPKFLVGALVTLTACLSADQGAQAPLTQQAQQDVPFPKVDSVIMERSVCATGVNCPAYWLKVSANGQTHFQKVGGKPHAGTIEIKMFQSLMNMAKLADVLAMPKSMRDSEDQCAERLPPSSLVTLTIFGPNGVKRIEDDQSCQAKMGPASGPMKLTPALRNMGLRGFEAALENSAGMSKWLGVP